MNFSHGSHADHKQVYDLVRAAADESGRAVGILADLQGPKIRLGRFAGGPVEWRTGDIVRITVEDVEGTHDRVSTTYKGLAKDAKVGDRLLVDDGKVGLVVIDVDGPDVVCEVTEGGPVSNNKGLSLPGMDVSVPAMSEKDIEDLEFALELGVDFVALSFVRSPADIDLVHQVMDRVGKGRLPVIAKIEKPEAVDNLEAIVLAFDGVMVARGDLGVELPLEHVPLVQKRAIQIARENAKPVIVATQMLESMITNSRPTRAEASDVANAVLDGADAVMLSGETQRRPLPDRVGPDDGPHHRGRRDRVDRRAAADARPAHQARRDLLRGPRHRRAPQRQGPGRVHAVRRHGPPARPAAHAPAAAGVHAGAVRAQPAVADVGHRDVHRARAWSPPTRWSARSTRAMLSIGRYQPGDLVVVVAGSPPGTVGSTNLIRVHRLGEDDHA